MSHLPRILVTAALGQIIMPVIADALPGVLVEVAANDDELRRACDQRVRFDVVLSDLTWSDSAYEFCYDGLDALATLRRLNRTAPVIVATHGYGRELDYLDEALEQPEVVGVVQKARGPGPVIEALQVAIRGQSLSTIQFPTNRAQGPSIYSYFGAGRRGDTAGRIAGAIAAGRATDSRSLEKATNIPRNTVNKLVDYLGPLIEQRKEHDPALHLTGPVVYRWVGEHKHYILSWCRRNGHPDVARRYTSSREGLARWPG